MKKIYVASSWRNKFQPKVVEALRIAGHEVYDFRNPAPGNKGFGWSAIDPNWQGWKPVIFKQLLDHPIAQGGFKLDWEAMQWADTCVLVLPCGRSAHIEAGYFVGANKHLVILLDEQGFEPELMMYKMAATVCCSLEEAIKAVTAPSPLPLLPPVKNSESPPPSPAPVRSALMLEVWKNQAGWNWHMKAPGWVLFNAPDTRYRSRSDAQHAGERAAAQLNITITEIKVR